MTRAIRFAPLTVGYLIVLSATTVVLSSVSAADDDRLLAAFSTNLHQLARAPVRVLVGSAFWTTGWGELATWFVLFVAVLVPVERRLGARRALGVFAFGHVAATLVVAAGLLVALRLGAVAPEVAEARDVGVSYGFFTVAAVAAYLLGPRLRPGYAGLLVGYVVFAAAHSHTFTDFGHLAAVAIGLACRPLVTRGEPTRRFDGQRCRMRYPKPSSSSAAATADAPYCRETLEGRFRGPLPGTAAGLHHQPPPPGTSRTRQAGLRRRASCRSRCRQVVQANVAAWPFLPR